MKNLLVLKTSLNAENSVSNALLADFVAYAKADNPDLTVITRDLNAEQVPLLNNETLAAIRGG